MTLPPSPSPFELLLSFSFPKEIRESTATSLPEYRLLVAEFGLLDAQLANLTKLVAELTGEEADDGIDGLVIDEDELEVRRLLPLLLLLLRLW